MTTDPQAVTYFSRLDADECWALVSDAVVGRVGWSSPEGISVVPVNFRVVEGVIVFHTTHESFLAGLAAPTEVAFQVDEIDQDMVVVKRVSMPRVHRSGRSADQNSIGDNLLKPRSRGQDGCERL